MLVNRIHNDLVIALDDSVVVVVVEYNIVVVEDERSSGEFDCDLLGVDNPFCDTLRTAGTYMGFLNPLICCKCFVERA